MAKYLNIVAFVALSGLLVALFVLNDSLYSGPDVRIFLTLAMLLLGLSAIWMSWKRKRPAWLIIASIFFGTCAILIGNLVAPQSILMRIAGSLAFSVIAIPTAALLTICWRPKV
jgi:hypothetical protein